MCQCVCSDTAVESMCIITVPIVSPITSGIHEPDYQKVVISLIKELQSSFLAVFLLQDVSTIKFDRFLAIAIACKSWLVSIFHSSLFQG